MKDQLTGTFTKGDRGSICRRPSDGGAWIVPTRGVTVELGTEYVLEVTGQTQAGNLRFAKIASTVEEHNRKLCDYYLPKIKEALEDETRLAGKRYSSDEYVTVTIEGGEEFTLKRTWRVGGGYRRNWLSGPSWMPLLDITPAVLAVLRVAQEAHEKEQEYERQERAAQEEQRRLEAEERRKKEEAQRLEQVAQDASLVAAFYAEHPEAREWLEQEVTWLELAREAVGRKYGRFVGDVKTGHYSSFSKGMEFYDRIFAITVGGKELEMRFPYIVEEYGDD
ncbi:MAG: hypothetical protein KBD21_02515 [Candidatus Pacebacteria bacterium]|nr:hypothetical protein [Candidatus Paceibacterota bacterium]